MTSDNDSRSRDSEKNLVLADHATDFQDTQNDPISMKQSKPEAEKEFETSETMVKEAAPTKTKAKGKAKKIE
jgi:hypothetical protein